MTSFWKSMSVQMFRASSLLSVPIPAALDNTMTTIGLPLYKNSHSQLVL